MAYPHTPSAQSAIDRDNRIIRVDDIHHKIHSGEFFRANAEFTLSLGEVKKALFKTGAKSSHIYGEIVTTGDSTIHFYEAPTTSADGTPVPVVNHNRNSSNTPVSEVYDAPTTSANGVLLDPFILGTDKKAGGGERQVNEWVLKPNTSYLIVITANAASSYVMKIDWYETD